MSSLFFRWKYGQVHYRKSGMGEPLLLIHGLYGGASSEEFEHNIYALGREFCVYAIDLLGFGYSNAPRIRCRAKHYPQLLRDFVRSVIRAPVHAVAGGTSAVFLAELAVDYPALLRKVVFLSPEDHPQHSSRNEWLTLPLREAFRILLLTPPFRSLFQEVMSGEWEVREMLRRSFFDAKQVGSTKVERLRELAREPGVLQTYASLEAGLLFSSFARVLPRVICPTLFVCGGEVNGDAVMEMMRLTQMVPGCRIEWIDNAGTWAHNERPRRVNCVLIEFLKHPSEVDSGRGSGLSFAHA